MAVQQNKKSPSKRGMHRAHDFLTNPPLALEPTTGEVHLRHHVSPNGYYRGRKVVKTKGEYTNVYINKMVDADSVNTEGLADAPTVLSYALTISEGAASGLLRSSDNAAIVLHDALDTLRSGHVFAARVIDEHIAAEEFLDLRSAAGEHDAHFHRGPMRVRAAAPAGERGEEPQAEVARRVDGIPGVEAERHADADHQRHARPGANPDR